MDPEGVIKFAAEHRRAPLPPRLRALAWRLVGWRQLLVRLEVVGQDPGRYGGAGFGNLSGRVGGGAAAADGPGAAAAQVPFLITGTQTGGEPALSPADFCLVTAADARENRVASAGERLPSSECLTHAAIYGLDSRIRYVFHVHAPALWRRADELGIPCTPADVGYGTPEMAAAVARLYRTSPLSRLRILAMGGHEDGIISFGRSAGETGRPLVDKLARALAAAAGAPPGSPRSRHAGHRRNRHWR